MPHQHLNSGPDRQAREFVLGPDLRATLLVMAADTDGRFDLTDGVLPPGGTEPLHLHTRYQEHFWVVSGAMTVWAGPDEVSLQTGDYYCVPMNVPHLAKAGPEGARALVFTSPAAFAELIARTGTPAHLASAETSFPDDLFMAVTAELGDVILGPPGTTPADLARAQGASAAAPPHS